MIALFPMFVIAVWRAPSTPRWPVMVEGPETERRRALWGQLLMIGLGGGLFVAGAVISTVGLSTVFVPTDLSFLATDAQHLASANPHLLAFIAHDRVGFGGPAHAGFGGLYSLAVPAAPRPPWPSASPSATPTSSTCFPSTSSSSSPPAL